MTQNKGINICAHVIIGLPGETKQDMLKTARTLANLGINESKDNVYCALKGTKLAQMYDKGEFIPLLQEEYVDIVCDFLEILPPDVTIHRLAGHFNWKFWLHRSGLRKFRVLIIDYELEKIAYQGKLFFYVLIISLF